jgi:hypothetical protein
MTLTVATAREARVGQITQSSGFRQWVISPSGR